MSYSGKFKDKNNNLHPVTSVLYGTCDTAAATAAKVVTCSDFDTLMTGVTIRVKFANANTAASPTVNINSTGAKSVYRFGSTAPVDGNSWNAGEVVELVYDGTSFFMTGADDLSVKQNVTDNSLETEAKTIVGAINENAGDISSLKSGLTNYELQNNINLEVPNRKNLAGNPYGVMLNSSGVFVSANVRSYIIPTNLGTITISVDDITKISDDVIRIGYCDDIPAESGTGVRVSSMTTNTYTITPNTGYKYIVVSNLLDNDYGWQDIQIELGSTATSYAPYIPSVNARLDAVESGLTNVVALGAYLYATKTIDLPSEGTGTVQFTVSDFTIPSGYSANLACVSVSVIGNWGIAPDHVSLSFDGGDTSMATGLNVNIKAVAAGGVVAYRVNVLLGIYKSS